MTTFLVLVFIGTQVFDYLSTKTILEDGGTELNLVMRWLMAKLGRVPALLFAKGGAIGIMCYLYESGYLDSAYGLVLLIVADAIYLVINYHNFVQLNKPAPARGDGE